ncbi:MAG TPA: hypothetical protein VNN79_08815 [Actinomycetota bacterium]|nr:hypothetical protein [Actinomycetota bacterium]
MTDQLYWYTVKYRRNDPGNRVYTLSVGAPDADGARVLAAVIDAKFSHTVETPRRVRLLQVEPCRFCHRTDVITRVSFPDGVANVCDICREKADDAREDLERGTAHFDRDVVEWRGTDVEVTG